MSQSHPVIVNMTSVPKDTLASLHIKYFPTDFTGSTGLRLLELYYDALTQVDDAFGWAAVVDGYTVGFACAVRNTKSVQHMLLSRSPGQFFYRSMTQVLHKPQILVDWVRRLTSSANAKGSIPWQRPADWADWYTYRPLVVDEAYRHYRLADALTHHLVEEAKGRGIPGLISIVERSNSSARVTHVRHGFREVWKGQDRIVFAKELIHIEPTEPGPIQ